MREAHVGADLQQRAVVRRGEVARSQPEPLRGPPEQGGVPRRFGRRQQQQPLRRLGKRAETFAVALLDATGKIRRGGRDEAAGDLRCAPVPRQLQQREWVAARLGDDSLAHAIVAEARDGRRQQDASVLRAEPSQRQLGQAFQRGCAGGLAHPEHQCHRFREQPSRHEAEDLARGAVQPLRVIHHAQQRALLCHGSQEAEYGQRDQEVVPRLAGLQTQRDAQSVALRLWKRVEPNQHRSAELMHRRERQVHLGLDAGDPRRPERRRLARAVIQERGLADPRLAADHQDRALAAADVVQHPIEHLALGGTAQQYRRTAGGHGPLSLHLRHARQQPLRRVRDAAPTCTSWRRRHTSRLWPLTRRGLAVTARRRHGRT